MWCLLLIQLANIGFKCGKETVSKGWKKSKETVRINWKKPCPALNSGKATCKTFTSGNWKNRKCT